jgi:alkylhydroperoxidase/carboxymuconolactone decarboxylase family protein YurZ
MHYHDSDDLKRLSELKHLAPTEFSAFVEFDKIVGREDGAIPRKYRELIATAVACTTQCPIASMCTLAQPKAPARLAKKSPKLRCWQPRGALEPRSLTVHSL